MVIEKVKRLVEHKRRSNIVDSITRLGIAMKLFLAPVSVTDMVLMQMLKRPKRFFGAVKS